MKKKKVIWVGNVAIGGDFPVVIQSMTNTKTKDIDATIAQIRDLTLAGAKVVRLAILDKTDALCIGKIKSQVQIPIVADIHFDYKLAILAVQSGADKIRINPGNIGSNEQLKAVVSICREKGIPIRIGINSGSLPRDIYEKYGVTPIAFDICMKRYVELIESFDFYNLILSVKATDIQTTIDANRMLNQHFDYPIHIGLTESGTIHSGTIRSSYVLGTLLNEGIGNTIRVSLTGNPIHEIPVAKEILSMFSLYQKPTLISCPTCGRTNYQMEPIVKEIETFLNTLNSPLKVAIMGCAVNGPGEAKDADIGIAGGHNEALLFKKGKIIRKIPEKDIIATLKEEILKMIKNGDSPM
ncbi:MAG: flavodoxin-dependent (E)-4-hydroxy-3-methylbut-2-enyl-diphosphate synthase [Prevotella sp.]|nr:flavodoxin-dependent (E)-4-hydroxy-3-methylbut-2-enyl-diphosphate synthase [Staphylococcus sp.]MCM1349955.1 flavodoxin-dependent (E)-4-hydroxy-3-methylbut-2-enyl-diphosphate synthase [Prevotella sp.]